MINLFLINGHCLEVKPWVTFSRQLCSQRHQRNTPRQGEAKDALSAAQRTGTPEPV